MPSGSLACRSRPLAKRASSPSPGRAGRTAFAQYAQDIPVRGQFAVIRKGFDSVHLNSSRLSARVVVDKSMCNNPLAPKRPGAFGEFIRNGALDWTPPDVLADLDMEAISGVQGSQVSLYASGQRDRLLRHSLLDSFRLRLDGVPLPPRPDADADVSGVGKLREFANVLPQGVRGLLRVSASVAPRLETPRRQGSDEVRLVPIGPLRGVRADEIAASLDLHLPVDGLRALTNGPRCGPQQADERIDAFAKDKGRETLPVQFEREVGVYFGASRHGRILAVRLSLPSPRIPGQGGHRSLRPRTAIDKTVRVGRR